MIGQAQIEQIDLEVDPAELDPGARGKESFTTTKPVEPVRLETEKGLIRLEAALLDEGVELPEGLKEAYLDEPSEKGAVEIKSAERSIRIRRKTPTVSSSESESLSSNEDVTLPEASQSDLSQGPELTTSLLPPRENFLPTSELSRVGPLTASASPQAAQPIPGALPPAPIIARSFGPPPEARAAQSEGKAKLAAGEAREAIADFERAIELDPYNPEYREDLTNAFAQAA